MKNSQNEATKKVLDTHQQQQQESASENEESDSITDQSSSMSENAMQRQKNGGKYTQTMRKTITNSTLATQFSVERSDTDGLRMKISAIRPKTTAITTATTETKHQKEAQSATTKTGDSRAPNNNNNNSNSSNKNNNSSNKNVNNTLKEQAESVPTSATNSNVSTTTKMSVDAVPSVGNADGSSGNCDVRSNSGNNKTATKNSTERSAANSCSAAATSGLPISLLPKAPCLSDDSESGCSEATTTTIAACNEKAAKKIKVKRKKVQTKSSNDAKKTLTKKARAHTKSTTNSTATTTAAALATTALFSSDSDDDNAPLKPQQQRAPRLLLTAINSKTSAPQLKFLNSITSTAPAGASGVAHGGSDNIAMSSSDNELPDLVNAAIKRVESDTDDTGGEVFRKAKTKNLPQYQSTLLQDFVERTQMLGQTTKAADTATAVAINTSTTASSTSNARRTQTPDRATASKTPHAKAIRAELLAQLNSNSQSDSMASSNGGACTGVTKKRRGRPKKCVTQVSSTATASLDARNSHANTACINESADSGVISTTSTTQSTSPLPKMSAATTSTSTLSRTRNASPLQLQKRMKQDADSSPVKSASDASVSNCAAKPKIDMAYLDKRMYATERVLYPPPRNKRRQSLSAAAAAATISAQERKSTATPATSSSTKLLSKEDLQLDPVWRKIDVNKKFRRPSVSGYKSDGGGTGNTTICSKILAAKSGYVSDYGSVHTSRTHHHNSGYKSDASGKSRYSTKSCMSRRSSRAKSCGYRSDCKESGATLKSTKFRRKRRCSLMKTHSKSVGNLNQLDQDILQLAGLSLGQSSEESNEYVCKPSLESLPKTSVSKKYGEINRFIATGEYFGRGSSGGSALSGNSKTFSGRSAHTKPIYDTVNEDGSQDCFGSNSFCGKLLLRRKNSQASELAHEILPQTSRKIKSRRSSAASYCSSYYSGTSRVKRSRRRRRSFRFPNASGKSTTIDSKLLTEIDIITSTFGALCRIYGATADKTSGSGCGGSSNAGSTTSSKEKLLAEACKLQQSFAANANSTVNGSSNGGGKRESRDKRALKKRKISENLDFALLSAAGASALTPSSGSTKRRHKKASSSSPDDHKLPLKKRHYLLTPGEKSSEAAVAVAAKLFASNAEAWAAAAAVAKSTASTKSQQQFGAKASKAGLTPKKRHLLQNAVAAVAHLEEHVSVKGSNSSPLRIIVDSTSMNGSKQLDVSPLSAGSSKHTSEASVHKKRSRLEGLVTKIAHNTDEHCKELTKHAPKSVTSNAQLDSEASCPPPGVFEPSVELEIQIPPIAKLTEAAASIITKSEVDSPLLMDLGKNFTNATTKTEGARVVETLLNKTGGNLILKRKRKKINRTGFPTVRRKKRKIQENLLLDITPDIVELAQKVAAAKAESNKTNATLQNACERVPQAGETSDTFVERTNRTPRLSVVALERLQGTPTPVTPTTSKEKDKSSGRGIKQFRRKQKTAQQPEEPTTTVLKASKKPKLMRTEAADENTSTPTRARGRKPKATAVAISSAADEPRAEKKSKGAVTTTEANAKRTSATTAKLTKKQQSVRAPSNNTTTMTTFSKETVHKIITAKSLETKVKLPAGIDPNTNFSCKIRLKRRSAVPQPRLTANVVTHSEMPKPPGQAIDADAELQSEAEIAAEAAAKDAQITRLEQDVLPPLIDVNNVDSEAASDTGDEKSSVASTTTTTTTTTTVRKQPRLRKVYLPAGLFSDYFKVLQSATASATQKALTQARKAEKADKKDAAHTTASPPQAADGNLPTTTSLLQPPPYCEKYFRRTQLDFELPYDIWWAYKNAKLPTRITVPSWNYRKIRTNVYAESVRPNMAGFDHPTCNCKHDVGCGDNCLNRMVYTECSPSSCPTREKCRNQKIQRHEVAPGVERFMTENKGWGVRTKVPIKKGTYILEYVGEVVTEREFKDRMGTIYLNDIHHYCLHLDGGLVIDGHRMGSDGRFVNHSCQPNCEMQKWSVNGLSRMALFAKRDIEDGEELSYDYNFSLFNPSEGQVCRCNMPQCRGVIGGKSQRIKPLPVEAKPNEASTKEARNAGRQRKHKARKNAQRIQSKDVVVARVQQLNEKEKKLVKQYGVFLVRNFEKIRRCRAKMKAANTTTANANDAKQNSTHSGPASPTATNATSSTTTPAAITLRRPSTPSSLAAQISALCSPRNMKTRGLTLAVQDPEVEKMAKMALILRDICAALETLKSPSNEQLLLISVALATMQDSAASNGSSNNNNNNTDGTCGGNNNINNKKRKSAKLPTTQKQDAFDLRTVQNNIEQGYYKQPNEFDADMQKLFDETRRHADNNADKEAAIDQLKALDALIAAYTEKKYASYAQLLELKCVEAALTSFTAQTPAILAQTEAAADNVNANASASQISNVSDAATAAPDNNTALAQNVAKQAAATATTNEDIIRCICGLYKDEGLMIQCARCMVWQHTECTKADVNADNYHCERCEPRVVDREIPLDDFTEEGYRYYLSLMRGSDLHVRQGDAVYVLRDIPIKDAAGNALPKQKHTYETIGEIDYNECDIFRVERLWKNDSGKRFIFGHHFLRPHETFHEPSRRFYPNEVVRVPLYEVVPIELVIGRCWVLDRTTFCKGRPTECKDEEHCYICELRVDKSARFFSKAKVNYPISTKSYAFTKFAEKLKISKTYAPHDVDPAMLKSKKQKTENETTAAAAASVSVAGTTTRRDVLKTPMNARKQRQSSNSPATVHLITRAAAPTLQTIKTKRAHLEIVLKAIKLKWQNTQLGNEPAFDLSYLLTGRGARQRKSLINNISTTNSNATIATTATSSSTVSVPV